MNTRSIALFSMLLIQHGVVAQDTVTFRDRNGKGTPALQTLKGEIESESLAGIKLGGKLIPSVDIVEVQYASPGIIRLDMPSAITAESAHKYDDAIREYRTMLGRPGIANSPKVQRHLEFKVAMLTAAKAEGAPADIKAALESLAKFEKDFPDSWQRVHAVRLAARLGYELDSLHGEVIRKLYDQLATAPNVTNEIKAECGFGAVETHLRAMEFDEARKRLTTIPANDARTAFYMMACSVDPGNPSAAIKSLEEALAKADESHKATIYNLLGDCLRLDPKRKKDALFSYLWVDVVYNQDPVEVTKAQAQLATLFKELNDENRAKIYRDKLRGR